MKEKVHYLTLSCADRPGIVAAISSALFETGANILEAQQFDDTAGANFFMRVEFEVAADLETIRQALDPVAEKLAMTWRLRAKQALPKVLLMVSKLDHCLGDLLYRYRIAELPMDVVGVVSNHPKEALQTTLLDDVPFHHLPISKETKPAQEAQIKEIIEATQTDLVVLARYMQVLSEDFCDYLAGRCINIHHSFLPGFKGGRPYHQAYDRGVKMIGATAHYVTSDLDEGPIIVQDVESVSHTDTPEDLVRKGRDVERRVLAKAVQFHLQERVLINGNKTIVFRD